ncbi:hypothetical protein RE9431_48380 (plasmid) [Prescottella equi]|uniref:Putative integral membrane protein n=1 Tax=Rhodococcus hoagii TaxID=43767 RepID=A0A0F6YRC5_RHOHA|nr:hypothetical protein [Prescottella equi]AKF15984.1 putative integral membrane protein [Prescottella equi]AKG90484.1 putative integral membrane protein [Prescottella equi]ARX59632.1 putative integral membrane protein [Prescottella equi]BCN46581.1 hypothetical protein RE9414_48610 [Prescottella equi]BCN66383.1 hypothetical protein RE9431_48380 [Prescottella equi]
MTTDSGGHTDAVVVACGLVSGAFTVAAGLAAVNSLGTLAIGAFVVAAVGLAYATHRARPTRFWKWCGYSSVVVLSLAALTVTGARALHTKDESQTMLSARETSKPAATSTEATPITTTATTPAPTTALPAPAGPVLPPEEKAIYESRASEFFGGALILANQNTYSNYLVLTITTDARSCTSRFLDVGERVMVAGNTAGDRYFRLTVLETIDDTSATIRAEDLPPQDWPTYLPSCP